MKKQLKTKTFQRRVTFFLFFLLINVLGVMSVHAQKVSVDSKSVTVQNVMSQIEVQTGYKFFYNNQVNLTRTVSFKASNEELSSVLKKLFANTNVSYKILDKIIVLSVDDNRQTAPMTNTVPQHKVTGKVTDQRGEPLIGATVQVAGQSGAGAITDLDGNFNLDNVSPSAQLSISFIGYETLVMPLKGKDEVRVILKEDYQALEDVVVIGYGSMKKSDLTSSISSVNSKVISQASSTSITEILQGKVAGMDIQPDRYEGEGRSLNIRGTRSLNASNSPLVIVDGIPGTMSDINVHDIESIEVMKDASSAAIYGSQGANGVILITTKKGKAGVTKISYDGYYGIRKVEFADMMNGEKFVQMKRDAYLMTNGLWTNGNKGTVDDEVLFTPDELSIIKSGDYYNWYDLVYRNGSILSNTVSITGGNERTQIKINLGYDYDKGYVKTNSTRSLFLSSTIDHRINKWAKTGFIIRYKNRNNSGFATYGQALLYGTPLTKPYDENGKIIEIPNTNEGAYNILLNYQPGQYVNDNKSSRTNLLGYLDLRILKGLAMHTNIGVNITDGRTGYFYGSDSYTSHGKNKSGRTSWHDYHLTANNTISYAQKVKEHSFTFDFVQEIQKYETDGMNASGENEDVEMLSYYNLTTNLENKQIGSGYTGWSMASFMGRLRYDYLGKYLLNASLRSDGSSRLAEGHKWGTFLSAGVAWRMSAEKWMKNLNWLSNLKIRASYGEVGNQAISAYQTIASLGTYPVLFGDDGLYAYRPDRLINKQLGWERTKTLNVGLDFGFWNNRLSGSVDVYKSSTKDLLMRRSLPTTIGFSNIYDNVGSTQNKGIELNLNANVLNTSKLALTAYGTFAYNKNKITKLATDEDDITNGWFVGKPMSVIYDYHKIGIWQLNEAEEAKEYNCQPGDIKIEDRQGTSKGITADDKTFLGQRDPKIIASFGASLTYANFDFSFNVNGRFGHIISSDYYGYNLITSGNRWCADVDYWTPDNPTNVWPRAANDIANRGLCAYMKGDYVKLQDITLGYDFSSLLNKGLNLKVSKARLYCQLRNIGYLYTAAGHHVNPESTSIEVAVPKSYIIGVNINF